MPFDFVVDRDGFALHGSEAGSGDPAIVFVHGWTCDRSHFSPQVEHLSARPRCVSVDLRGHGRSRLPAGSFRITDLADDVAAVITALGVDRPVVVGHSMGGLTAYELAARRPESVRGILLVDPAILRHTNETRELYRGVLHGFADPATGRDARKAVIEMAMFVPETDPDLRARITDEMVAVDPATACECFAAVAGYDGNHPPLGSVPAMHIGTAHSLNDDDTLRALLPGIELATVPGTGHFAQLEAPEQVNALIDAFIDRLDASSWR